MGVVLATGDCAEPTRCCFIDPEGRYRPLPLSLMKEDGTPGLPEDISQNAQVYTCHSDLMTDWAGKHTMHQISRLAFHEHKCEYVFVTDDIGRMFVELQIVPPKYEELHPWNKTFDEWLAGRKDQVKGFQDDYRKVEDQHYSKPLFQDPQS